MRLMFCLLLITGLTLTGCEIIAPNISKAQTESKQYIELQKEVAQLERIANALEKIAEVSNAPKN